MQAARPPSTPPNRAAAAVILVIAAVVGFGVGTWFGQATKASAEATSSQTSAVVSTSPSVSPIPSPSTPPRPSHSASTVSNRVILVDQKGSGDFTSADFVARRGWQIQWQTDADTFDLQVHGQPDVGRISDHPGPVSGVVSPPQAGTFHIEIKADGPWSVKVLQGP